MPSVFFSYSHLDENLRDQLEKQLAILKRQGIIETWHDRRIGVGEELHNAIDAHIETDDIILLLVSPDFLASDYVTIARCSERWRVTKREMRSLSLSSYVPVTGTAPLSAN